MCGERGGRGVGGVDPGRQGLRASLEFSLIPELEVRITRVQPGPIKALQVSHNRSGRSGWTERIRQLHAFISKGSDSTSSHWSSGRALA